MIDSFWLIKFENVLMKIWYNPKSFSNKKPAKFLIICHGCPSHPYDENPATNQRFMQDGFVLVYPEYIGTWGSGGQCNFENAVDTVLKTIKLLRKGAAKDIKSNHVVKWNAKEIILIGGSFGGSVALVAGAKSNHIKKIVAVSPVTDWRTHNKLNFKEEDLTQMWKIINGGLNNYWRARKPDYMKLMNGKLDLNPIDYIDVLKEKNTLFIHGINDKEVNYRRSENFNQKLKTGSGQHKIYLSKQKGHIVPRHLSQRQYYKKIIDFLSK